VDSPTIGYIAALGAGGVTAKLALRLGTVLVEGVVLLSR
jgi:hypothetical protein